MKSDIKDQFSFLPTSIKGHYSSSGRFHHEENSMWKKIIEAKYSNNFPGSFPNDKKTALQKLLGDQFLK